jgi:hypothetical protein
LRLGLQCCVCHPYILTSPHLSGYPINFIRFKVVILDNLPIYKWHIPGR